MKILCETCGQVVSEVDASTEAELVLIGAHARDHQSPHSLWMAGAPQGDVVLRVECLKCGDSMTASVPREYVAAFTLCFHSEHEGHRMRLSLDGKQFYPPEPHV